MIGIISGSTLGGISVLLACLFVYRALRQRLNARALTIQSPNGIAEGRFVPIGSIDQWVQIRGEDRANPILLIVSGHGLSMGAFTPLLRSWEQHFTVAQWDRRGIGKTLSRNGKANSQTWTLDRMVADGIDSAEYLCRHLGQEKVILVGLSQGSALGLLMIKRRPDLFHAYVGTGQIIDMLRNETVSYGTAIERARATHQTRALKALEDIGAPPYPQVRTWIVKQRWGMITAPEIAAWQSMAPRLILSAPNYSLRDLYSTIAGLYFMPQRFYDDYMAFDARRLGTGFGIPFFVFQGDEDVLTPTALTEEYMATVTAPASELVLLAGGGHMAILTHSDQFLQALLQHVRPLTISNQSASCMAYQARA